MSEATRAYIYSVLVAVGVVAIAYGLISQEEAATWAGLAAVVLQTGGNALARANTSTKPPAE